MLARISRCWTLGTACLVAAAGLVAPAAVQAADEPLHLVVMDPLAAPLSCPCVEGYAQRNYENLAAFLTNRLGREVTVSFGESLSRGLKAGEVNTAHIVIGKDSVVRADAAKLGVELEPVAQLTGKDGATTQTGLIVIRSGDSAQTVKDLDGYRILYGPAECDEKFAAARTLLAGAGIDVVPADQAEVSAACSEGASKLLEWGESQQAAAVISSYAAPLLEGCGTINKGDLRVVAETAPLPFITAFVNGELPEADREAIQGALMSVMVDPELVLSLETLGGFVPLNDDYPAHDRGAPATDAAEAEAPPGSDTTSSAQPASAPLGWTGWRGPHRDGRVRALPTGLPQQLSAVWEVPLAHAGLGGIAATQQVVVIGDRNLPNTGDEFRCYDADTGDLKWMVAYPAEGHLDYDNTPRATPLIATVNGTERVYLLGAFGHLTCADLATGLVLWQFNMREQFGATGELVWGTCSSPLMADGKLIVNPGGAEASLVALDPATGEPIWQTPGGEAGYGSLIVATLGGKQQIVGHDRTTLGGWDVETGRRLWTLAPPREGDFNVPTPLVVDGRLLVTTEGNGTRLYEFDEQGRILRQPVARQMQLAPDMSTPVVVGNRVYCVCQKLYCLDVADGLKLLWTAEHRALADYAPVVADQRHLLLLGRGGELLLVDAVADDFRLAGSTRLFRDAATQEAELYSHPAVVGNRLYARGEQSLACFELP